MKWGIFIWVWICLVQILAWESMIQACHVFLTEVISKQPSTNYRPKKGKKDVRHKRKLPPSFTECHAFAIKQDERHTTWGRPYKSYARGCVISAFAIRDSYTENEIWGKMKSIWWKVKLSYRTQIPVCKSSRKKIIDPACKRYNWKVWRELLEQTWAYISAVSDIPENDISNDSLNTSDKRII